MSIHKPLAVVSLAILASTPFLAQASPLHKATDACVSAFVDTYLPNAKKVRIRVVDGAASPLDYFPKQFTIALSAYTRSGQEVATARCVASNKGQVIVLDNPPPAEYVASADFVVGLKR
ncbi:hypothetical protein ACFPN2_11010 [Steroidobacter flavus]|uniref:Uncharacterized protein n=1 Tax=Steroidobacter flavus TaxID=1842136 RepID=A0ABV8SSX3_9GAMM